MSVISRAGRTVVRFSGPEAHRLINDVLTGPFAEGAEAGWWALLSPQGKVQAEGLAGFADGAWWLDLDRSVAESFLKRMKMYRLRARAEIEELGEGHAVGWSEARPAEGIVHEDGRAGGLGYRVIAEGADWPEGDGFLAKRIAAGVPELGPDFGPDTAFAHDIGMDLLGGVDFAKGCYVGQEVVSRMKHRGTARRRPVIVSGLGPEVAAGAPILAGGRESGHVGAVLDGRAVGIVRLDRIDDPGAATAGGAPVTLALPGWASYAFGESAPAD